jgi:hypothetical protein
MRTAARLNEGYFHYATKIALISGWRRTPLQPDELTSS